MDSKVFLKCPVCSKLTDQKKYRPFCSSRCKWIDLGNWIDGSYRLPTEDVPDEAEIIDLSLHLKKDA
jgi:endogenous inhibitor of DNA gyrase (YacG/DUF329 family)